MSPLNRTLPPAHAPELAPTPAQVQTRARTQPIRTTQAPRHDQTSMRVYGAGAILRPIQNEFDEACARAVQQQDWVALIEAYARAERQGIQNSSAYHYALSPDSAQRSSAQSRD